MTFEDQNKIAALLKRVDSLEKAVIELQAQLITTNAHLAEIQVKRGPGRPKQDKEAA